MASGLTDKLSGLGSSLAEKGWGILDSILPPERRAELIAKAKAFVLKNPKVSAFLLFNISLTGGPLVLFICFSIAIFVFALIVALIVALLFAVLASLTAIGLALCVLFPTIFFTTLLAVFLFLWCLGGYYILKWFNKGNGLPPKGDSIGDKLNALTGNKLDFVMDNAREGHVERQMGPAHEQWKDPTPHKTANGTPRKTKKSNGDGEASTTGSDAKKQLNGIKGKGVNTDAATNGLKSGSDSVSKATGAGDHVEKVKGVPRKLESTKGTVQGTVGGATGLT